MQTRTRGKLIAHIAGAGLIATSTLGAAAVASAFDHLTSTTAPTTPTAQTRTAIDDLTRLLPGRGICKHPDATVRFITSTLTTFPQEITAHTHGTCTAHTHP